MRMKFSREWLDLGEVICGLSDELGKDSLDHDSLFIDVFDVNKDKDRREAFFDKLITQCGKLQK